MAEHDYLSWYLQTKTKEGWRIVSHTPAGAQIEKPKQASGIGVTLFVVLPALGWLVFGWWWWAVAIVGAILVLCDYLLKKPELSYITAEEAKSAAAAYWEKHPPSPPAQP